MIDCEGACSDNANNVGHGVCVMGFRVLVTACVSWVLEY